MKRALLLGLALACCFDATVEAQWARQQPKLASGPRESLFPLDTPFRLESINGKPTSGDAMLQIDSSFRGSGYSGCNNWSAALYPIRGQRLVMGPVALTKKICPAPFMAQERLLLVTLHSGPTWSIDGPILTVKGRAATLRFRRGY